ncbi:MAG: class I SAM-dependent methyltransferase [Opitutales bacterium]|jgi:SAM-dependent methyltransferase
MPTPDPTRRFSDRADDYLRHRPHYPAVLLEFLHAELGLRPSHVIADIGSGTGFLAEVFLAAGHRVYGVEPNDAMRVAGEHYLARYPNFTSIAARAEATSLLAATADFVVAGQAFHWFDPEPTRREFFRILKPDGWVALVRNELRSDDSAFMRGYRELSHRFRTDDRGSQLRRSISEFHDPVMTRFFAPSPYFRKIAARHADELDFAQALGRMLSFSSIPLPGEPNHDVMVRELRKLFDEHQQNGRVRFEYEVEVVYGRLTEAPPAPS